MFVSNEEFLPVARVSEFYDGKSIFLTGASGFLGKVLLEALLRFFPSIRSIYILMRSKKGQDPEERKESILKTKLFDKLKEENPDSLRKIHVIPGDISLPNLGISERDYSILMQEVTIIFHCASVINFVKPMRFMFQQNCLGVDNIITLCRKLKKVDALVYTSTKISNYNRNNQILEKVYRLPFHSQIFIDEFRKGNDDNFEKLLSQCEPKWPNGYCFSKCLSENILADKASDFPVAIIRPGQIFGIWKSPLPGYIDDNTGATALGIASCTGFLKVLRADAESPLLLIPVDVVAHNHIVCAWSVGTGRLPSPLVINSFELDTVTIKMFLCTQVEMSKTHPFPRSYQTVTNVKITKSKKLYWCLSAWYHNIPAIVIDCVFRMQGKKHRILNGYKFIDKTYDAFDFFSEKRQDFQRENLHRIGEQLHPEDKKLFHAFPSEADFFQILHDMPNGSPCCDWSTDKKSPVERKKNMHRNYLITTAIQWFAAIFFCCIVYLLFLMCDKFVIPFFT